MTPQEKQEIIQEVTDSLTFMYNEKYRFDKPTELSKPIYITNLPTSSTGLRTGQIWNDTGTLKIIT